MRRLVRPFISALSLLAAATLPVQAADLTRVEVGKTVEVDAHNTCKEVTNKSSTPIMVPHGSKAEWTSGDSSFLQNVARMPSITVADCGLVPHPGDSKLNYCESGCFLGVLRLIEDQQNAEKEGVQVFEYRDTRPPMHLATDKLPSTYLLHAVTIIGWGTNNSLPHTDTNPRAVTAAKMAFGFCKAQKVPGYYMYYYDTEVFFGVHCVKG